MTTGPPPKMIVPAKYKFAKRLNSNGRCLSTPLKTIITTKVTRNPMIRKRPNCQDMFRSRAAGTTCGSCRSSGPGCGLDTSFSATGRTERGKDFPDEDVGRGDLGPDEADTSTTELLRGSPTSSCWLSRGRSGSVSISTSSVWFIDLFLLRIVRKTFVPIGCSHRKSQTIVTAPARKINKGKYQSAL